MQVQLDNADTFTAELKKRLLQTGQAHAPSCWCSTLITQSCTEHVNKLDLVL